MTCGEFTRIGLRVTAASANLRIGSFMFDPARFELSRDGRPIRLQPQPAQVLATLLAGLALPCRGRSCAKPCGAATHSSISIVVSISVSRRFAPRSRTMGRRLKFMRTLPRLGDEFSHPVAAVETGAGSWSANGLAELISKPQAPFHNRLWRTVAKSQLRASRSRRAGSLAPGPVWRRMDRRLLWLIARRRTSTFSR